MAKKIKFNLKFGETSIRTLSDLQENFSLDDVLENFENGMLYKFLERRDYKEEAEKIKMLATDQSRGALEVTLRGLLDVFGMSEEKNLLEEFLELRRFLLEREKRFTAYVDDVSKEQKIINEYFDGYERTVKGLIENCNALGKIRAHTKELLDNYKLIIEKDYSALLKRLTEETALYPVLHMLTHDFFKNIWKLDATDDTELPEMKKFKNIIEKIDIDVNDKSTFPWLQTGEKFSEHWEDIEVPGKEYMILNAPPSAKVRKPNDVKNEFTANDINLKFKTFDGIQFRCINSSYPLVYVEV